MHARYDHFITLSRLHFDLTKQEDIASWPQRCGHLEMKMLEDGA